MSEFKGRFPVDPGSYGSVGDTTDNTENMVLLSRECIFTESLLTDLVTCAEDAARHIGQLRGKLAAGYPPDEDVVAAAYGVISTLATIAASVGNRGTSLVTAIGYVCGYLPKKTT